jgi:hypothetical protein
MLFAKKKVFHRNTLNLYQNLFFKEKLLAIYQINKVWFFKYIELFSFIEKVKSN